MPDLDIRGLLGELVHGGVDFLVIGGVAVGYHGHVRATKDLDVVPAPDSENLEKLSPAAIEDVIGDLPIKMVSYEDLVALKEQAGRPEDLADLQRLRQAREGPNEGGRP